MSIERPTTEEKLSQKSGQSEKEIKFEEVAELEEPMQKMLEQMIGSIEKGEYDLIIGVDASGRIPTLILEKFIKHIYAAKNTATINTRFVAGDINKAKAKEKINEWRPQKKVLIVEDTIESGASIKFLCRALRENNIPFDVATVGLLGVYSDTSEIKEELKEELGVENIYFGITNAPGIYGKSELSGIKKEGKGEVHSRPYKQQEEEEWGSNPNVQKNINQARKDAGIVVEHLINWYESQKGK